MSWFQFFKDKELRSLFHQMQTYKVLLSLLYENKRYAELFELYVEIRKHLELYELFPEHTINCLAFAACYHLVNVTHFNLLQTWTKFKCLMTKTVLLSTLSQNTPEHFQYAQDLFYSTKHAKQVSRSTYLLAGLALKQNEPTVALNLLPENRAYVTIRFIRLMAFTQSGRLDRACEILRQTAHFHKSNRNGPKPYFGIQMVCTSIVMELSDWNH